MASVYFDASREDDRSQEDRIAAGDSPAGSNAYYGTSGRIDVMPGLDVGGLERQLRDEAKRQGVDYSQSDLEGVLRNTGYQTGGVSLQQAMANAFGNYEQRANNIPGQEGGGGGGGGSRSSGSGGGPNLPGNQFDDSYTNMLEGIAKSQMGEVRNNPALDQLMGFLQQRFSDLSTNPGYSQADMATLNTQAFEPIEAMRNQARQNELQRTARAGYLPTSGLTNQNQMDIDRNYDQMRTVANRDLSINAMNRRQSDLNQALDIGRLRALTIPAGQRSEELALGNLLYQLPRTAMFDALSVINGSPNSSDAFNQALMLAQQAQRNQQTTQQNDAAFWGSIGNVLFDIFRGGQTA